MKKAIRKALSILLVAVMLVCSAPLAGFVGLELPDWLDFRNLFAVEAEAAISGTCGDNLTWTLDTSTGELVISGTGAMNSYSYTDAPWHLNRSYIKTVKIGNGVARIGNYAFYECDKLTSVIIPDSVTSIGICAFDFCRSLTSITIPDSVTSIGNYAFRYCESLTSITIPDSVASIGTYAFYRCYSLTSITIPDSVTSIGYWAFYECYSLTSITIPDSVTSISDRAFYSCESLTSITIPDSVTSIGYSAFENCESLTSITIPDSVTSIGNGAFSSCDNLTSITVDANNKNYSCNTDGVLFNKDKTALIQYPIGNTQKSYTIPDSVTSIGNHAFDDCDSLTIITIPDSVTSIGDRAFYSCESLTSITIPDSVTSIGEGAFRYCESLTSITIGNSVTSIGDYAFYACESLTSVIIPDSVTSIGDYAFYNCGSLSDVYYSGTESEWNTISIGRNNEDLTNATIHFNSAQTDEEDDLSELRLSSNYPANGATKLSYDDDLVLNFNMNVEQNLSTFNEDGFCVGIYDYYTDELVKSFDGLYTGYKHNGKTMTFEDAFRKLEPGKKYYIMIADDAIFSKNGDTTLFYKGINDKNEWVFSYLNPTNKEGYSLDIYSSQNIFTVNKGESGDVSVVLSLNGEVCGQNGISFAVTDTNIAQISNIRREKDQTVLTLKGNKLGSTLVTVTDAGSKTVEKFPVFVSDQENVYYFSEMEKYSEFSPFVISDMYIDNLKHTKKADKSSSVTFSVYNMGHSYGAVDVYDQYGNMVDSQIIDMFDGDYPTDLFTHIDYTQKLVTDFAFDILTGDFDFSDFKNELYSKETAVSITVPENGYYVITKSITASETCLLYNAFSLALDISFDAVGWIGDVVEVSEALTENFLTKISGKYLEKLCEIWLEKDVIAAAESASVSAENMIEIVDEMFVSMGTTFIDAVIETIPKVVLKATKEQVAKVFLGASLKQCGLEIVDSILYGSIKAAKWIATCTDIYEYRNSASAYVYDLQSSGKKISNGVISYSDADSETIFHSILVTNGYYSDYIDAIHRPEADAELYSISMIKNGEKIQPETPVTIYIPLPPSWDADGKIYVYHINDNYEREELSATVENGYVKFVTDGFSYFVISNEELIFIDEVGIRTPSTTTIKYGDGIILHADLSEALPAGWSIKWSASNGNFDYTVSAEGTTCTITPSKSGDTTFTATVYDAEGNEVCKDEQTMTSKAGFFQKLAAFFKKIFGLTKTYPEAFKGTY